MVWSVIRAKKHSMVSWGGGRLVRRPPEYGRTPATGPGPNTGCLGRTWASAKSGRSPWGARTLLTADHKILFYPSTIEYSGPLPGIPFKLEEDSGESSFLTMRSPVDLSFLELTRHVSQAEKADEMKASAADRPRSARHSFLRMCKKTVSQRAIPDRASAGSPHELS